MFQKELNGYIVFYVNEDNLNKIYKELFIDKSYTLITNKENPFIIDCGSHIGLSMLYFKQQYPKSKLLCFEPDPNHIQCIQQNIMANSIENVELVAKAVSDGERSAKWYRFDSSWGNTINDIWNQSATENQQSSFVETTKLSTFINEPVDFLKLDIEGEETRVINEIKNKLHFIKNIELEFHSTPLTTSYNNLEKMTRLLSYAGFSIQISVKNPHDITDENTIKQSKPVFYQVKAFRIL